MSTPITWNDVLALPGTAGLASIDSTSAAPIVAYANTLDGSTNAFSNAESYFLARCYLAAHIATMSKRGLGASGAITSQSAGGLARSFGTISDTRLLASTTFGSLYLMIIDSSPARCPVVV